MPSWLYGKSAIAAYGLIGLAIYQATQGHYDQAMETVLAALATLGLRHAVAKAAPEVGTQEKAADVAPYEVP
jgi:hypothetical protein